MNDNEIVALYWQRNEDAIRESETKYGSYCMTVSMNILSSRPDAEECVNDTWLRAWDAMPPARPSVLRTFLGKITRHLSIDRYRYLHASARNRDLEIAMSELGDAIPLPEDTDDYDLCALMNEFLEGLEPTDCRLFVGRYWHGYAVKVMAAHYGMTPNAVSLRLHRTRTALKAFLEERGCTV